MSGPPGTVETDDVTLRVDTARPVNEAPGTSMSVKVPS